jgi:hypothetical protein
LDDLPPEQNPNEWGIAWGQWPRWISKKAPESPAIAIAIAIDFTKRK